MRYERLYADLHRLPNILAAPCLAVLQAFMRRRYCARGVHRLWMGNYCCFECGTLVSKGAWRYWDAVLRDGTTRKVVALNEKMARHMIVHDVGLDALNPTKIAVHPTNIVACTPGEIAPIHGRDPKVRAAVCGSTAGGEATRGCMSTGRSQSANRCSLQG